MCKANIDYPMHGRIIPSKIVVAVDGSEGSRRAAAYAFDIAGKDIGTCTLYLVHVIPPQVHLTYSSGYFGVVPPDLRRKIEEEAKKWFNRILAKVRKRDNLYIIEKIISTGASIVAEIANFADEKHIDLIVVGATGKSGLRKLLLGSVSSGLVTHSHCSVMIIR